MRKAKVYVKLPPTGLGNMLLTWARGFIFVALNDLQLVTSGWGGIRWGAWIRWEKKKRMYWGYFRENSRWQKARIEYQKRTSTVITEPEVEKTPLAEDHKNLFLFCEVSPSKDLFGPIRSHRPLIRTAILEMLTPEMKKKLEKYPAPAMAVHIRRGDFKIANPITPLDFFIKAIAMVRETTGKEWPVTVFTDASPSEIKDVLDLPDVFLAENKPDILDILLMSRSKVIVLSRSSTFSYWGAFLSDAIVIKTEGDWQEDIRPADVNRQFFEGKIDFNNQASVETLKRALKYHKWQEKVKK